MGPVRISSQWRELSPTSVEVKRRSFKRNALQWDPVQSGPSVGNSEEETQLQDTSIRTRLGQVLKEGTHTQDIYKKLQRDPDHSGTNVGTRTTQHRTRRSEELLGMLKRDLVLRMGTGQRREALGDRVR